MNTDNLEPCEPGVNHLKFCTGYGGYHTANPDKPKPKPYVPYTLKELKAGLENPSSVPKDQARWAIFSTLYKDPLSRNHELQRKQGEFVAGWGDLDKLTGLNFFDVVQKVSGILDAGFFAYTSSSATAENPKCRIVVPYDKPIPGREHVLVQKILNDKLHQAGLEPDRATERAGQLCYLPNKPNDFYDHFVNEFSGPFDPLKSLADEIQAEKDASAARHEAFLKRQVERKQKAQERIVSDSKDVLRAFNESFPVRYCLEKYGYRPVGEKYISPNSESGKPGVSVSDDGQKWFSHHSSDAGIGEPKGGGTYGDAWDLFRYWGHGSDEAAAFQAAGDMFYTESGETFNQANRREYAQQKGAEKAERMFENLSNPSEWDEPEPIRAELLPVEPLRAEMIPKPFLPMVKDVSHRMSIPMDYVAVPLVVVAGSVIGTGCRIRPKRKDDWQIVSNLWGGLLGPPSRLKSPALEETSKKILGRLEAEAAEDFEQRKAEWLNECRRAKLSREVLQSEYKGAFKAQRSGKEGRSPEEILEELRQLEESTIEPVERRYKTNDATVEKIVELLAQNPRGLLYYRDELVGLFKRMDKPGYEQDRAFFLEAWSGNGSHVDDRIGRGTKRADNLCLSFLGSIQPSKLAGYLRQALSETENDGFIQRVQLMVYPDMPKYHHVDQWPDSESRHRAYAIIKRLANMDFTDPGFETEDGVSFLRFDDQAQNIFNEWYQDLMGKLEGDEHPAILEHFGKYRSLMPSLALIFHLVEIADGQAQVGPVSKHCAIQAAAWCEYLESHARRIYSMVLNGVSLAAGALSKKLLDRKLEGPFKVWHIQTKGWGLLTDNGRIRDAVTFLQDAGWVRELPREGGKVGRPKDAEYEVNPKIFENGQEQTQVNQVN